MNRNATRAEAHLKMGGRPSLYTSDIQQIGANKNVSILASLEPDRLMTKLSRGWTLLIVITVLFVTVSYWAYANADSKGTLLIPAWAETALNISQEPSPLVLPANQSLVVKLERPAELPVEESHAATIVTEPTPPISPNKDSVQPTLEVTEKFGKLDVDLSKKRNSDNQPVQASVAVDQKISSQKPLSNEVAPLKKAVVSHQDTKTAKTSHTPKQIRPDAAKHVKDEDVELIAALLARVSPQEASGKKIKHKAASTSAKSNGSQADVKRQNQVESQRDIVARNPNDTTESLLKRCKALGFFEGEFCRVRICSKLWGLDPACPATEQASLANVN